MNELVLGTHNKKKRAELELLLAPLGLKLLTLADFDDSIQVVEDGDTFQANATKKAVQQAVHLNRWVLGEDSGLAVDALQGAPGIYSARYAGTDGDDEANNRHLLSELGDLPLAKRTAHYVCHMTLADPTGQVHIDTESTCRGRIRAAAAGSNGFGYDPLFEVIEYGQTFGQLGPAIKSVISHRAKSMRQFVRKLTVLRAGLAASV
jgi:XTP/dITP diphosphohydrolase